MEALKLRLEMSGRPVKKKDYFTLSSLYFAISCQLLFFKGCPGWGRIWDLFFIFVYFHTQMQCLRPLGYCAPYKLSTHVYNVTIKLSNFEPRWNKDESLLGTLKYFAVIGLNVNASKFQTVDRVQSELRETEKTTFCGEVNVNCWL